MCSPLLLSFSSPVSPCLLSPSLTSPTFSLLLLSFPFLSPSHNVSFTLPFSHLLPSFNLFYSLFFPLSLPQSLQFSIPYTFISALLCFILSFFFYFLLSFSTYPLISHLHLSSILLSPLSSSCLKSYLTSSTVLLSLFKPSPWPFLSSLFTSFHLPTILSLISPSHITVSSSSSLLLSPFYPLLSHLSPFQILQ